MGELPCSPVFCAGILWDEVRPRSTAPGEQPVPCMRHEATPHEHFTKSPLPALTKYPYRTLRDRPDINREIDIRLAHHIRNLKQDRTIV